MTQSTGPASSSVFNPTHAVAAPNDWREKVMHKCRESVEVKEKFFDRYADAIGELAQKMADRFRDGHKLWVLGNGGSACDAQHIAVEFVHPIIEKRRALPAFDLVSQVPVLTAISNDKDYARIFVDQIALWGQPGDMVIAISTSGNSPNLIYALEEARPRGLLTIAFSVKMADAWQTLQSTVPRCPVIAFTAFRNRMLPCYTSCGT